MTSAKPPHNSQPDLLLRDVIPKPLDRKAIWICMVCAVVLTASYYFGQEGRVTGTFERLGLPGAADQFRQFFKTMSRRATSKTCVAFWNTSFCRAVSGS